jgi:hypothetical protein
MGGDVVLSDDSSSSLGLSIATYEQVGLAKGAQHCGVRFRELTDFFTTDFFTS